MASSDRFAQMLRDHADPGISYGLSTGADGDYTWLMGFLNGDEPDPVLVTGGAPVSRFAAPIRLITFDGVDDDGAALVDPLSGRDAPSLFLRGKHGKHFEIDSSTDDMILHVYDDGIHLGDAPFVGDAVFDGTLEVTGSSLFADVLVDGGLVVTGDVEVDGDADLGVVRLTPDPGTVPQLLFRHNATRTYWGLGGSDSSLPNFQVFNDVLGVMTEQFEITETGRVNAKSLEVYAGETIISAGSLTISAGGASVSGSGVFGALQSNTDLDVLGLSFFDDTVTVDGGVEIDSGGLVVNGTATFHDAVLFNDPVEIDSNSFVVGTNRFEVNETGLGFFGATPIGRPTVVGDRDGNVALENLIEELANLGLVTDLTS